jgi:hypothetical protein
MDISQEDFTRRFTAEAIRLAVNLSMMAHQLPTTALVWPLRTLPTPAIATMAHDVSYWGEE